MSWYVVPAVRAIFDQANAIAPNRSTASDGTIGDPAHAARASDHNPDERGAVKAGDLTDDPANGCPAHEWAEQVRLRCKAGTEKRPTYIISNDRICSETDDWEWREYTGDNEHRAHVHFSIDREHENDTSPWFTNEGDDTLSAQDVKDINKGTAMIVGAGVAKLQKGRQNQTNALRRAIWRAAGWTVKEIEAAEAEDPNDDTESAADIAAELEKAAD